jgi:hypothetical protein
MHRVYAVLGAGHVQAAMDKIDLIPAQRTQFRRSQPMPEGQQDHGGVPVSVSVVAGCLHQPFDLAFGEVFAGAVMAIWLPTARYCSLYSGWGHGPRCRNHLTISLF